MDRYVATSTRTGGRAVPLVYRFPPTTLDEVVCNPGPAREVAAWYEQASRGSVCLVIGPNGSGKTTCACLAVREKGGVVVYKDLHSRKAKATLEDLDLVLHADHRTVAVVLDNVDMSCKPVLDRVKGASATRRAPPLVLVSNNAYHTIDALVKTSTVVRFDPVPLDAIHEGCARVLALAGVPPEPDLVRAVAQASKGDMAYALNQLQFALLGRGAKDGALEARSVHLNAYQACEELMTSPALDVARGSYLVACDTRLMHGIVHENAHRRVASIADLSRAEDVLSDVAVALDGSDRSGRETPEVYDTVVACLHVLYRTQARALFVPKYPEMFNKARCAQARAKTMRAVESASMASTGRPVSSWDLSRHLWLLLDQGDPGAVQAMARPYGLEPSHLKALAKNHLRGKEVRARHLAMMKESP